MVIFKCQMVLSEKTDIDHSDLDYELRPADNYPIFASSPMQKTYLRIFDLRCIQ